MSLKIKLFFSLLLIVGSTGFSQNKKIDQYNFKLNFHGAMTMKHSINMAHLANQHPWALELHASKQDSSKKYWQQLYNYPLVGSSIYFYKMDPSKPLGNCYAWITTIQKPILKNKKNELSLRLGFGPAYIHKTFDIHNNYKNNLISSKFNFCINAKLNYQINIGQNFNINTGVNFTHFSNGSIKVPNLGINLPSVFLGIGIPSKVQVVHQQDSLPAYFSKVNFIISGTAGFKETLPVDGPKFLVSSISTNISKTLNRKSSLNLGLDGFYDASVKRDSQKEKLLTSDFFKIGITAGHELLVGRAALLTQFGYYIFDPLKLHSSVYQRYALKYYFKNNIFISAGLKAHFGSADYVEWGLGKKF